MGILCLFLDKQNKKGGKYFFSIGPLFTIFFKFFHQTSDLKKEQTLSPAMVSNYPYRIPIYLTN